MSTPAKAPRPSRFSFGRFLLGALFALIALGALWMYFAWNWSFSKGERAGWVQKFSNKGVFCKTWEGEIALVAMPGAIPEKFEFTVLDDAVAEKINRQMGRRVSLSYEQKIGLPTSCFGETRYYVTNVVSVDDGPNPQGMPSHGGMTPQPMQQQVPVVPAPAVGAPAAPVAVQPAPAQPTPGLPSVPATAPAPMQGAPMQQAPVQPVPVQPAPAQPAPVQAAPVQAAPAQVPPAPSTAAQPGTAPVAPATR